MGAKAKLCGAALWLGFTTMGGAVFAEGTYNSAGARDPHDIKYSIDKAFERKPITAPHAIGGIAGLMLGLCGIAAVGRRKDYKAESTEHDDREGENMSRSAGEYFPGNRS